NAFPDVHMPSVADILSNKGGDIHTTRPDATVLDATRRMNQHQIGALVVMEADRVVGIITERDVLRRVVAAERHPAQVLVGDVMTSKVICCSMQTDVDEVSTIMRDRRIRHLPVCDPKGNLLGLVSIGDVNAQHASTQEQTITFLNDYLYGWV